MRAIAVAAVIVVLVLVVVAMRRGRQQRGGYVDRIKEPTVKEHYGPPPGKARALDPSEMGDRGWADVHWPRQYEGNSASSVSQFAERSA